MSPPDLPYVPLFEQLRRYTRAMQATYGAIAAYQYAGHQPTVREIAFAADVSRRWCEGAIAELIAAGMMRRHNVGAPKSRVRYELLGPTLFMATRATLLRAPASVHAVVSDDDARGVEHALAHPVAAQAGPGGSLEAAPQLRKALAG